MSRIAVLGGVALLMLSMAAPVAAVPKTGCSASPSGWLETSVSSAATTIWPSIVDTTPFPGGIPDLEAALGGLDKNGDGDLCLLRRWGEALNPNSHWYRVGIELFGSPVIANYLRDNTAAAADA